MADYDDLIREHYAGVAAKSGLSSSSSMADRLIRRHETEAILAFVTLATKGEGRLADFGCGNGYTLEVLAERFPGLSLCGFELTTELLALAEARFEESARVEIRAADVREAGFWGTEPFDAVILQRVLMNLLDPADQARALDHVVASVKPGGYVLFVECFEKPYEELNEARAEFDLEPIGPAFHNLCLPEGFFDRPELVPFEHADWTVPPNFLSTHYFITRAFEPGLTRGRPFKRNSQVQRFLSMAFPPAIGNFAPLKIHAFRRA